VDANGEVEVTTAPRLISTGGYFNDIQSLMLAAEGMVVCKFKKFDIVNAILSLIGSYFLFNVDYPKGPGGQSKKHISIFRENFIVKFYKAE